MKKILVLGGPNFIGRNLLLELQNLKNFQITLFNRGKTNASLFPEFERIIGDRNTDDIKQIGQQDWEYIIDLSCYYPAALRNTLAAINQTALKRYIFVSTCSVYNQKNDLSETPTAEDGLILSCTKEQEMSALPAAYGEKKVACEQLLEASGLDYISLRPGLVYGAYDYTNRFYYWLYQVQKNDPILLPNNGASIFSLTYVGDLVNAIIKSIHIDRHNKIYNVMSQECTSIKQIVDTACVLLDKNPTRVNAPASFLKEQEVTEWAGMPLWIDNNHFTFSNQKLTTDFHFKYAEWVESIQITIDYHKTLNWPVPTYGISEKKRLELVQLLNKTA